MTEEGGVGMAGNGGGNGGRRRREWRETEAGMTEDGKGGKRGWA